MLDQVLEVADNEAALLLHPAIEGHRFRIRPQPGMQLPIGSCKCIDSDEPFQHMQTAMMHVRRATDITISSKKGGGSLKHP